MSDKLMTKDTFQSLIQDAASNGVLRSHVTDPDYIGAAWKNPYPGRHENLVKPGMLAVLVEVEAKVEDKNEVEKVWELSIVGKSHTEHVGYFKTKRAAAVALVKMIKGALEDCEKLREELWKFIMANECIVM